MKTILNTLIKMWNNRTHKIPKFTETGIINRFEDILKDMPPDILGYIIDGRHLEVILTKEEQEEWVRSKGEFRLTVQQVLERGVEK